MTLCRSRRSQVVEMHYCRLFAHNPKVGGSNPPPATKPNPHENSRLDLLAGVANAVCVVPFSSHLRKAGP